MSRRTALLCTLLASVGTALAAPTAFASCGSSTPATLTFADPLGDVSLAPDIGAVGALVTSDCKLGVNPQIQDLGVDVGPDGLIDGDAVFVYLDTDGNTATGDPLFSGADKVVGTLGEAGGDSLPMVGTWDPATSSMSFAGGQTLTPVGGAGFVGTLDELGIAGSALAHVLVGSIWTSTITGNSYIDDAPDSGVTPPTLSVSFAAPVPAAAPVTTPAPPTATPPPATGPVPGQSTPSGCVVPRVKGLRVDIAETRIANADCDWDERYAYSTKVRKGRIIRTSPAAGTRTTRTIVLTISRGPRRHHRHARGRAAVLRPGTAEQLSRLAAALERTRRPHAIVGWRAASR